MGATNFKVTAHGATPEEAFKAAQAAARHEYGHRGYTGSIAEKDSYVVIHVADESQASAIADEMLDRCDERIDDKWGPAGCIAAGCGVWIFFGYASC